MKIANRRKRKKADSSGWGTTYGGGGYAHRRRGKSKKKIVLGMLVGLVAVAVLLQFNVIAWQPAQTGWRNVTSAVSEGYQEASAWTREKLGLGNDLELALPVSSGVVVEEYGVVLNENGEENYHSGVDIQVPAESQILAAADGEVTAVDTRDDGTFWVTIKHDASWSTMYGRLGEVSVAVGDQVKQGDVIGVPNNQILHFEVLEKDQQKDPVNFFDS